MLPHKYDAFESRTIDHSDNPPIYLQTSGLRNPRKKERTDGENNGYSIVKLTHKNESYQRFRSLAYHISHSVSSADPSATWVLLRVISPNIRSHISLGKRRELMERTWGVKLSRRLSKASHINGLKFQASRYSIRFRVRPVMTTSIPLLV